MNVKTTRLITLACALATSSFASANPGAATLASLNVRSSGPVVQSAGRTLNVSNLRVAEIDTVVPDGHAFSTFAPIGDQVVTLNMRPFNIAAPGFKVLVQRKGAMSEFDPGTPRTYRGTIDEIPGAVVAASLLDDGLYARILLPDSSEYWIEPLAARLPQAGINDHAVYAGNDIIPSNGVCATIADEVHGAADRFAGERGSGPCGATFCVAQVACDADRFFYQQQGSSATSVTNRINAVMNAVNVVYERDVQIRHTISTIIIRTDASEPYTTTDPGSLLNQFALEWNTNRAGIPRDVAHLFTGRGLDGSVIGIAQLGVICNTGSAYSLVESNCCGSLGCSADLSEHELGHNWNAPHCSCQNPAYTMNPSITCANRFSAASISTIVSFRNSRGCLSPDVLPPPPTAFNLVSPANGSTTTDTGPFFDWTPSTGANSYTLSYSLSSDLTNPTTFTTSVSQLDASNGTFSNGQTIYWSVVASDQWGQQTTMNPAVANFTVQTTPPAPCPGDANGDHVINGADLSVLLGQFGSAVTPNTGADFNGDGQVNGADLSVLLGLFGSAC